MGAIKTDFGQGGANLTPDGSAGDPSLADVLRDVADDLSGAGNDWQSGVAVVADAATLPSAGVVVAVEATAADSAGVKQQQFSDSPAEGFVQVEYDADGVPTLTFNGVDAVTECAVMQLGGPNVKTTKA